MVRIQLLTGYYLSFCVQMKRQVFITVAKSPKNKDPPPQTRIWILCQSEEEEGGEKKLLYTNSHRDSFRSPHVGAGLFVEVSNSCYY